ncbi:MAG: hypothetical protein MR630_05745 [Selenomonas sp.]|uniref:hypothetical protein n=1 Tax=Selenomonas sp. TaxID=2053611 RepID=UPI0025EC8978|nr:hypothetical protein [Selenomonas sp.]MCI6232094.1 hypothetical protein [Selenomonas sp.]MDY6268226.1 hypothetical protein [Selenomonadaceae bacterium]
MKNKIFSLMVAFIMLCLAATANANIQMHYAGNPNYPMVSVHQGHVLYVDKTSISVQLYNPPQYRLAIATFYAPDDGHGPVSNYHSVSFSYDYDCPAMYSDANEYHEYIDPAADSGRPNYELLRIGEAAFYIEYGIKFYGRYNWKSSNTGYYENHFPDEFYATLKGE